MELPAKNTRSVHGLDGETASQPNDWSTPGNKDSETGGSVCESNAPTTSEMPSTGFEDRNRQRPAYASVRSYAPSASCSRLESSERENCSMAASFWRSPTLT